MCITLSAYGWIWSLVERFKIKNLANFVYQFLGGTLSLYFLRPTRYWFINTEWVTTAMWLAFRCGKFPFKVHKHNPKPVCLKIASTESRVDAKYKNKTCSVEKLGLSLDTVCEAYHFSLCVTTKHCRFIYVTHFTSFTWALHYYRAAVRRINQLKKNQHLQIA